MACDPEAARHHAISEALAALAPPGVLVGVRRISSDDERALHDVERAFVSLARDKRRHEFATGRALLRSLIGIDIPIPVGADRRPIVPDGMHASLAHNDDVAVAAVSRVHHVRALGIDIERRGELEPEVADVIVRADDDVNDPMLALVLKESAFKAWSALGGRMLDHHELRVAASRSSFTAIVQPDGDALNGRFAEAARSWIALVVVKGESRPHLAETGSSAWVDSNFGGTDPTTG